MTAAPKGIYYGWFVLAASAFCEMLIVGATLYGTGLFVIPLQKELGLSRADASSSVPILFLGGILFAPYAGRILDRYSIRLYTCAGALLMLLSFTAIALTSSVWVIFLALLVPGAMSFVMLGPMTTATLTSRWFTRHRGLALGLAAIASSSGGFTVIPLLSQAIQAYGWRNALLGEAVLFFAVIVTLGLLVLRDNPDKMGLAHHPENLGRPDAPSAAAPDASRLWRWRGILDKRDFWAPSLLIAASSGIAGTIIVLAAPYSEQLGYSLGQGAFLISAFSLAAAATKILVGVMADRWNQRLLLFVTATFLPLALLSFCFFSFYGALLAACVLAGIAQGGALPISASLLASRFGTANLGSVMGWTYVLIFVSTILAVRVTGSLFDHSGSYHIAFLVMLGYSLLLWLTALVVDSRVK